MLNTKKKQCNDRWCNMLSPLDNQQAIKPLADVLEQLYTIHDATEAMEAISSLLMPVMLSGDEQLELTMRSQVAVVFKFFAKAMQNPLGDAIESMARLDLVLNNSQHPNKPA